MLEDGIVSFLVLVNFDGVDDCALVSVEDDCCCDVSGWVFILCRIAGGFDVSVVAISLVCISFVEDGCSVDGSSLVVIVLDWLSSDEGVSSMLVVSWDEGVSSVDFTSCVEGVPCVFEVDSVVNGSCVVEISFVLDPSCVDVDSCFDWMCSIDVVSCVVTSVVSAANAWPPPKNNKLPTKIDAAPKEYLRIENDSFLLNNCFLDIKNPPVKWNKYTFILQKKCLTNISVKLR